MTGSEERLLRALASMCQQYLADDGHLEHKFMSAGEDALELLAEHGLVELSARGGVWTEAGHKLLDSD